MEKIYQRRWTQTKVGFVCVMHKSELRPGGFILADTFIHSLHMYCKRKFTLYLFDNASDDKYSVPLYPNIKYTYIEDQNDEGLLGADYKGINMAGLFGSNTNFDISNLDKIISSITQPQDTGFNLKDFGGGLLDTGKDLFNTASDVGSQGLDFLQENKDGLEIVGGLLGTGANIFNARNQQKQAQGLLDLQRSNFANIESERQRQIAKEEQAQDAFVGGAELGLGLRPSAEEEAQRKQQQSNFYGL